jgi:hypothetical protein
MGFSIDYKGVSLPLSSYRPNEFGEPWNLQKGKKNRIEFPLCLFWIFGFSLEKNPGIMMRIERSNERDFGVRRSDWWAIGLILLVGGISSAPFWTVWSGDAVIHLVYADQAADGHWFEYNPGEKSVGTTSIGWTFLMALFFRLFGISGGLMAQKLLLAIAFFAVPIMVFHFLRRENENEVFLPLLTATIIVANPGTAYNAPLGMENPVFAATAVAILISRFSVSHALGGSYSGAAVSGLLLGVGTLLRPEGILLVGLAFFIGLIRIIRSRSNRQETTRHLLVILFFAGLLPALGFGFLHHQTGVAFGGASAQARVMQARLMSWEIIPRIWYVDPKVLIRCVTHLPWLLAILAFPFRYRGGNILVPSSATRPEQLWFTYLFLLAAVSLYAFVTGGAHLGRYFIPVIPCAGLIFAATVKAGEQHGWFSKRIISGFLAATVLWYTAIYGVEWFVRRRDPGQQPGASLESLAAAACPAARKACTDRFFQAHEIKEAPSGETIGVGCVEVQCRWDFDHRIRIISLDGRTWPIGTPSLFDHDGFIDGIRLVETLRPDLIIEPPQLVKPDRIDHITGWFRASPGSVFAVKPGLRVLRIPSGLRVFYEQPAHSLVPEDEKR